MSKAILGLDLSTNVGWACGGDNRPERFGVLHLPKGGGPAGLGALYAACIDALADLHALEGFRTVWMEAPLPPAAQTQAHTARVQLGLAACVDLWCYRRSVECVEVSANTVRAKVIGNGRAKKTDVMDWAERRGWRPQTHDVADALAVLAYARGL